MTKSKEVPVAAGFSALGLDERVLKTLTGLGYEEPTAVQEATIPPLLAGRDVLGQAATGTGKTAAFALPLIHLITPNAVPRERTTGLVLVPTRELAMQVAEAIHKYGRDLGVSVMPVYGGAPMESQIRSLKRGVDIVVATPGRALDHINRKTLHLGHLKMAVLDEADEMLDMGFAEDLEAILKATPELRQTALFSATLPSRIQAIARTHLRDPIVVTIDRSVSPEVEAARVRQVAYIVPRPHKIAALGRVLDVEQPTSAIVFCRTRGDVDALTEALGAHGQRAEALHGGLSQDQRDRVMKKFRAKKTDLLVATDVAARGLDVKHVSHVINFDVPADAEAYVHRIGRTGRAGREGVAITFAEPREHRLLRNIERATKQKIEISEVPTIADLKAKRLELTRASVRDAVLSGGLDMYRKVVESLAAELDVMDIAAAAIKLVENRRGEDEPEEIPLATRVSVSTIARPVRGARVSTEKNPRPTDGSKRPRGVPKPAWEPVRLFIGGGRKAKIRPGDLVGAITGELGIDSSNIGAIAISDRFSTVEVPSDIADTVIAALGAATIKGKKLLVRRDRA